eukprot:TRINITY_DN5414_c0_g1_i6.p1 TRINITY_DN5414_c0_g1~~TRINITY_DN5414_c0_g1_i6.p1  ORF type:complete len:806 (+),score=91.41 TRINITY_DN5414_c0_g1_i6:33-2450(+)
MPSPLFSCCMAAEESTLEGSARDWTVATEPADRLTSMERLLQLQEAKMAQLEVRLEIAETCQDLEERLMNFIKLQLGQQGPVASDAVTPSAGISVEQHPEVDVAVETSCEAGASRAITYDQAKEIYVRDSEFELSKSTWEAAVLLGTPAAGAVGSLFLLAVVLINSVCQTYFCLLIEELFAGDEGTFYNGVVRDSTRWRLNEAHSTYRMDRSSWVSLATRVCQQDGSLSFGNAQANILGELRAYDSPIPLELLGFKSAGTVLACLCLLVWYLTCAGEIQKCFDMFNALCTIPSAGTRSRILLTTDNALVIEAISWQRRIGLVLLNCHRTLVAAWLTVSGTIWLCSTTNLVDLILNAVALGFVIDLDELIFTTLAPPMVKRMISHMAPLKCKAGPTIRGQSLKSLVVLVGYMVFIFCLRSEFLDPLLSVMESVEKAMCQNETRFVIETNSGLGYGVVVPTELPDDFTSRDEVDLNIGLESMTNKFLVSNMTANELRRLARFPLFQQGKVAVVVGSAGDFFAELLKSSVDFDAPICVDELHYSSDDLDFTHPAYLAALRFGTGTSNATRCADFAEFCRHLTSVGVWVRSFCSKECACGTSLSLLVDRRGCSAACTALVNVELSAFVLHDPFHITSCKDKPVSSWPMPAAALMLADMEIVLQVKLPIEDFFSHGCRLLSLTFVKFAPFKTAPWVPDALCGRSRGSNVAVTNSRYQSLRTLCPVTCGCSLDFTLECPGACTRGSGSVAIDKCAAGLCPGKQMLDRQIDEGVSCSDLDKRLNATGITQAQCETVAETVGSMCCLPSVRLL